MTFFRITILALLLSAISFAQEFSVSGTVVDSGNGTGLRNANVVFIHLPDSTRKGDVTSSDGSFEVKELVRGRYIMRITYIGYTTYSRPVQITDKSVALGKIRLAEASVKLGEVEIEGRLPVARVKDDTTEVSADAFKVNKDATAEDLVTKIPGVVVQNGQVQAQGQAVQKVLVDNKPFFGNDPTAALKNLPAEVISSVQFYDERSEQSRFTGFDDGNTQKTINFITRAGMRNGQFGKFYAGYGADDEYQPGEYKVGGSLNLFSGDRRLTILGMSNNVNEQNFAVEDILGATGGGSGPGGQGFRMISSLASSGAGRLFQMGGRGGGFGGGDIGNFMVQPRGGVATTHALGLNYSDKWTDAVEVSGSYFFNLSKNDATSSLLRRYVFEAPAAQLYGETETAANDNMNHRFNMRAEWTIDTLNSVLIRPRFTFQQNEGSSVLFGETMQDTARLNNTNINRTSDLDGLNLSNDILYRRKFETRGRTFSLSFNQAYNSSTGTSGAKSNYTVFGANGSSDLIDQTATLDRAGWTLGGNIAWTEPITEKLLAQVSYNVNQNRSESDKQTFNLSNSGLYDALDTTLTNTYDNRYTTHAGGADLRWNDEELNGSAGVSYQVATLAGTQTFPYTADLSTTFTDVLPNAQLRWRITREKNLNFFYRTRTNAPSVEQLQNVLDNSNPLQLRAGNPDLTQDYQHTVMLRYTAADMARLNYFFAMLYGSYTYNSVANSTLYADQETDILLGGRTITIPRGAQFTRPVNVDGAMSLRTMMTYGLPVEFLKTNMNVSAFVNMSRTPGLINGATNYASSPSYGFSLVFASNISPELDYTLSSLSILTTTRNTLQSQLNSDYFMQSTRVRLSWTFWEGFVLSSDVSHTYSSGQTTGYNQDFVIWNIGLGKKFLANDAAELRLTFFDLLNQNRSISQTSNELYIEDNRTEVLQRYALLTFSYNLRNFTSGMSPDRGPRHGDGPPMRP